MDTHWSGLLTGAALIVVVLWEAFETLVFPRQVTRKLRWTRAFYRATWIPWRAISRGRGPVRTRETLLSVYGPLSLLLLLISWAALLVLGFALLHWGAGSRLQAPAGMQGFLGDLYFSGATLFTLSLGDVIPVSRPERLFAVLEGGTGLAFFAMVIGYLPVVSQAYSRREVNIVLLDTRAGSPPSAGELLIRHVDLEATETLTQVLQQWERWSAELLEAHISFPVLAYWRSQHDNQSWVAALTMVLDVSALVMAGIECGTVRLGRMTFAIARHAAVDLCRTFGLRPRPTERLPAGELARLRRELGAAGVSLREGPEVDEKIHRLRAMYEPYMNALAEFLLMPLPRWLIPDKARDNWQHTS